MDNQFVFGNFLETELLEDISNLADSIRIPVGMAERLPQYTAEDSLEARLVLWDGINPPEILGAVANPQTGTLSVLRAQEGTSSRAWPAGTQVICSLTAEIINAALEAYFDYLAVLDANFLKLTGGTLTGPLVLAADPTEDLEAATKHYADNVIGNKLPLAGGTMLGSINMNNNRVLNLPVPVATSEPVRKFELDTVVTNQQNVFADRSGILSTAGTSAAYTLTSNSTITSLLDGQTITMRIHAASSAGATLDLNSTGPRKIQAVPGEDLPEHFLQAGIPVTMLFDQASNCWYLLGAFRVVSRNRAGDFKWSAIEVDHDDCLLCDGRALPRTHPLFQVIGEKFGVGDGATTFNIPKQSNKGLVGRDLDGTGYVTSNITTTAGVVTATLSNIAGVCLGMYVNAANCAAGTRIVGLVGTTATLSVGALASGTEQARLSVLSDPTKTGASGGEIAHVQRREEVGPHIHPAVVNDPGHTHGHNANSANAVGSAPGSGAAVFVNNATINSATTGITVTTTDNKDPIPTPNLPPSLVANLFIYAY